MSASFAGRGRGRGGSIRYQFSGKRATPAGSSAPASSSVDASTTATTSRPASTPSSSSAAVAAAEFKPLLVSPTPLVDIGINLTSRQFGRDWQSVVRRSGEAGVNQLILTGTSLHSSLEAHRLIQTYDAFSNEVQPVKLYSTAGVHPHDAKSWDVHTGGALEALLSKQGSKVVAVGECGLDFDRNFSPQEVQKLRFVDQLELSTRVRKPLFLHERAASDTFLDLITTHLSKASSSNLAPGIGVVHCFTGTLSELQSYLSLGLSIGITGWVCDTRRGLDLARIVSKIPPEKLMIETDAPFLFPFNAPKGCVPASPSEDSRGGRGGGGKSKGGRRNEPCLLPFVLQKLSECTDRSMEDLAKETTANAQRMFQLD